MPTYQPHRILTVNRKCGSSLDLPIKGHCRPTKNCSFACYARTGPQAWTNSTRKHDWVSQYLAGANLSRLAAECQTKEAIRLNGSGDLNKDHLLNIIRLAKLCPNTTFWGMTRKVEVAEYINKANLPNLRILLTVDASSPKKAWEYKGMMCYGPRMPADKEIPRDKKILTIFPRHFAGKIIKGIPEDPRDCQAVYHRISGCLDCKRCFTWWDR